MLGLQDRVFARILTFENGLGCLGAAILGSVEDCLVNFAQSFNIPQDFPPFRCDFDWISTFERIQQ
jgi:8-amino-7-oxononanoate synthase